MKTRWRAAGLRVVDLLNPRIAKSHIENACQEKNAIAHALFGSEPIDPAKMFDEYAAAAEQGSAPFATDTGNLLNKVIAGGDCVMSSGFTGYDQPGHRSRDVTHLSPHLLPRQAARLPEPASGPTAISTVIGVTKALCHPCRRGPFPTEIHDSSADTLRASGSRYGAGHWQAQALPDDLRIFPAPLLQSDQRHRMAGGNGKMDVLDELAEIPVCIPDAGSTAKSPI